MTGIKEKISASIDKLTHHGNTSNTGANTSSTTGTGVGGTNYSQTSTGAGTGAGTGSTYGTTGTGVGAGTGSGTQYNSATNVGAPGVSGYDNTTPTGIDSAGYNTVSGTGVGATTGTTTGGVIDEREIIDSKTFTKTVDHEVLIEKKQYELEHRPVQEQYVVETRKVGEARVPGAATELVGNEVAEVDHRIKEAPRGDRTVVVQDVDVPISEVREFETGTSLGNQSGVTGTGLGNKSGYGDNTTSSGLGREI